MGFDGASKAVVEVVSETMCLELAPLGVRVISLVMGAVATDIMTHCTVPELSDTFPFKPAEKKITALGNGEEGYPRMPTDPFVKKLVSDVPGSAQRKLCRGQMAFIIYWVTKLSPLSVLDKIMSEGSGLDSMAKK